LAAPTISICAVHRRDVVIVADRLVVDVVEQTLPTRRRHVDRPASTPGMHDAQARLAAGGRVEVIVDDRRCGPWPSPGIAKAV
jgi:hypothetical protein